MEKSKTLPVDDDARRLALILLRTARSGALATLAPGGGAAAGHPFASLASVANDADGAPVILISRLSSHTAHLEADARCSLLLTQTGKGDPLAHPRITLVARARRVPRESEEGARVRRRFLARHPKAQLYVDFPDFAFFSLAIERASLNGGFGRAYDLVPGDLLTDLAGAEALLAAEEGAIAHMNEDHAEAIALYAKQLLHAKQLPRGEEADAAWRLTGIDPDGCDLASGERVLRLSFPRRVDNPAALRQVLKGLADSARSALGSSEKQK